MSQNRTSKAKAKCRPKPKRGRLRETFEFPDRSMYNRRVNALPNPCTTPFLCIDFRLLHARFPKWFLHGTPETKNQKAKISIKRGKEYRCTAEKEERRMLWELRRNMNEGLKHLTGLRRWIPKELTGCTIDLRQLDRAGEELKRKKNVVGEQKANTNEDRTWNFKQENVVA